MAAWKESFNNLPISTKLNISQTIALVVLFTGAIIGMTSWLTWVTIRDQTATVQQINQQTLNMIQVYNNSLETHAAQICDILRKTLPTGYMLDTTQRIVVAGSQTPALKAGGEVLNLNFTAIDQFSELHGAVGTVFVRDGSDFTRITTSLKTENGDRAIGTKLDREHPAYAALQAKKTYTGRAVLFGRDYMTHYLPMVDASGTVVGALFAGVNITEELAVLRQNIASVKFGKNGYMFIVDSGRNAGTLIAHQTLEGKNLYGEKDVNGFAYIRAMLDQKDGVLSYWFTNTAIGETSPRERTVIFNTIPKWNWIIVSSLDKKDLAENAANARNLLIIGAIVLCALLFSVVFFVSRRWVTRPLTAAVSVLEKIAEGHLTVEIPAHGKDEVGRLLDATTTMAGKMRTALSDIQAAAKQLGKSAEHLVSTAGSAAEQSEQQSSSAMAMAAGIEEMNANIVHVSDGAKQAHQVSLDSDKISNEGALVIQRATDSMGRIADTVRAASDVVGTLEKESKAISNIVGVIKGIADQTDLLALNATIEAARAGEHGRGFAVVADEVRILAERTSSSTQEISLLIQRIIDGTNHAVSSMEAGVRQVEEGVAYAGQAGESISSIRTSASQVSTATISISDALTELSLAVTEISSNIGKIAAMADQNSQIAKETAQCASELEQLSNTLQGHVAHFTI
ncbi:MAG: methyl-accepting chemotaxis protein [Desulfobulbus sp.]|nr:methyl-accepting chemotaxis protein [Desulfobulbus sp.]